MGTVWFYVAFASLLKPYVGFVPARTLPIKEVLDVGATPDSWFLVGLGGIAKGKFGDKFTPEDTQSWVGLKKYGGIYYLQRSVHNGIYTLIPTSSPLKPKSIKNTQGGEFVGFSVSDWGLVDPHSFGWSWIRRDGTRETHKTLDEVIHFRTLNLTIRAVDIIGYHFLRSETASDGIWLSNTQVVVRWNGEYKEVYKLPLAQSGGYAPALLSSKEGMIIGTGRTGLYLIANEQMKPLPSPAQVIVDLVFWDERLVVGSWEGAFVLNGSRWMRLTDQRTLFLSVEKGRLFVGSKQGLAVFSKGGTKSALDFPVEEEPALDEDADGRPGT